MDTKIMDRLFGQAVLDKQRVNSDQLRACEQEAVRRRGAGEAVTLGQVIAEHGLMDFSEVRKVLAECRTQAPEEPSGPSAPPPPPRSAPVAQAVPIEAVASAPLPADAVPVDGNALSPFAAAVPVAPTVPEGISPAATTRLVAMRDEVLDRQFGQYRIHRRLGEGEAGAMYLGENETLGKMAAIKVLAANLVSSKEYLKRFIREARQAAQLDHPNIVQVWDVGEEPPYYYLVLQYVEGETLRDRLDRERPLPVKAALKLIIPCLDALATAHQRGVLHRGLTTSNTVISTEGQVMIADFGIHRTAEMQTSEVAVSHGTPMFMPPEQWYGKPLDSRSDIYSLGVVLYQLITGDYPYSARAPLQIMRAISTADPEPLRYKNAMISAELDRAVLRMIAKNPEHRFQDAASAKRELETVLELVRQADRDSNAVASPSASAPAIAEAPAPEAEAVAIPMAPAARPPAGGAPASQPTSSPGHPYAEAYPHPKAPARRIGKDPSLPLTPRHGGARPGSISGQHRPIVREQGTASGEYRLRVSVNEHGRGGRRRTEPKVARSGSPMGLIIGAVALLAIVGIGALLIVFLGGNDGPTPSTTNDDEAGDTGANDDDADEQRNNDAIDNGRNNDAPPHIDSVARWLDRAVAAVEALDADEGDAPDNDALIGLFAVGKAIYQNEEKHDPHELARRAESRTGGLLSFVGLLLAIVDPVATTYFQASQERVSELTEPATEDGFLAAADYLDALDDWPESLKDRELVDPYDDLCRLAATYRARAAELAAADTEEARLQACTNALEDLENRSDVMSHEEGAEIEAEILDAVEEAERRADWDDILFRALLGRLSTAMLQVNAREWSRRLAAREDAIAVLEDVEAFERKYVDLGPGALTAQTKNNIRFYHFDLRRKLSVRVEVVELERVAGWGTVEREADGALRILGPMLLHWRTPERGGGGLTVTGIEGDADGLGVAFLGFAPDSDGIDSVEALLDTPAYRIDANLGGPLTFYWYACANHYHITPPGEDRVTVETQGCDISTQVGGLYLAVPDGATVVIHRMTFTVFEHELD